MQNEKTLAPVSTNVSETTTTPTPSIATPKKPSNKCHFPDCNDRVVKIVGDCKFCGGKFCSRHRVVEAHACPNIESCRKAHFDKNEKKLMNEKTEGRKVQGMS